MIGRPEGRPPSSTLFKHLLLRNRVSNQNQISYGASLDRGTKVCSNGPGQMAKMAAMLIYGKNLKKIFFFGTKRPMTLKVGMQHRVLEYFQVCSNNDPGLILAYFSLLYFCMGKR